MAEVFADEAVARMPDAIPLGLAFLWAMMRATSRAGLVNVPSGENVETVVTLCDQRLTFFA